MFKKFLLLKWDIIIIKVYGIKELFNIFGMFIMEVELIFKIVCVDFYMVYGNIGLIFSYYIVWEFGFIYIINIIVMFFFIVVEFVYKYDYLFYGIGKIKDYVVKLYIDKFIFFVV